MLRDCSQLAIVKAYQLTTTRTDKMTYYMNVATGLVDIKDGWDYENECGDIVNAVDSCEVVEVEQDENGNWEAV